MFPAGIYVISDTLNSSGVGNHLMGSGSGMFSGPQLVWTGQLNGTMLSVKEHTPGAIRKDHIGVKATVSSEDMMVEQALKSQSHLAPTRTVLVLVGLDQVVRRTRVKNKGL